MARRPRVVAMGGGHGTAVTLRAARRYAGAITAIVSVADDGGSSGRLRALMDVVALGDLRRCLVALAKEPCSLTELLEHRFEAGELSGHSLGNLMLVGLIESNGGLLAGLEEAGRLLSAVGEVLPATVDAVTLHAETTSGPVDGQKAISVTGGVKKVQLRPTQAAATPRAVSAIMSADQVILGPGSLFTSVIAATLPTEISRALKETTAKVVFCCNLAHQIPETDGFTVADHVEALVDHGVNPDVVVCDSRFSLTVGSPSCEVVDASVGDLSTGLHDSGRLAEVMSSLA